MSNNVKTICPHCGHVEEEGECKVGRTPRADFMGKIDSKWHDVKTKGIISCGKCKKEFAYSLMNKVICLTSKIEWGHDARCFSTENPDTSALPEKGAAVMKVSLSDGHMFVRHGDTNELLAFRRDVPAGTWSRLWEFMEKELHLTGADNPTVPIEY